MQLYSSKHNYFVWILFVFKTLKKHCEGVLDFPLEKCWPGESNESNLSLEKSMTQSPQMTNEKSLCQVVLRYQWCNNSSTSVIELLHHSCSKFTFISFNGDYHISSSLCFIVAYLLLYYR